MNSRFIAFEGCDGTGKTSQAQALADTLRRHGYDVVLTCEPPKQGRGGRIRELLMSGRFRPYGRFAEAAVFLLARQSHLHETIAPALEKGSIVITDRFTDSTLAYQFSDVDLDYPSDDLQAYLALQDVVLGSYQPGLKFLLDAPFDALQERYAARAADGTASDPYETNKRTEFDRIRAAFLTLRSANPAVWRTIDAQQLFGAIHLDIKHATLNRLRRRGVVSKHDGL